MTWLFSSLHSRPTPGSRDSSRLGLSVRTWLAEAATAADLKGGSGGRSPLSNKKVLGMLELGRAAGCLGRYRMYDICFHVPFTFGVSAEIASRMKALSLWAYLTLYGTTKVLSQP